MPGKIIEEPFHLTNADANVTEADGTAATWSDIFKYQVPQGVTHMLNSEHTFSGYVEDASAEVAAPDAQVKIEVRDPSEQDKRPVYGPAMYTMSTEFQDRDLMAHLNCPAGGVQVTPRSWIVVMVNDDGTIDASDSYFDLLISRVRESVI